MEGETGPSRPSRKQAPFQFSTCSSRTAQEGQAGAGWTNLLKSPSFCDESRTSPRKLRETCSNNRGHCCRGVPMVGLGGPPVPPTTCSGFALSPRVPFHLVRTLAGRSRGGETCSLWHLVQTLAACPRRLGGRWSHIWIRIVGKGAPFRIICPTSVSPFLIRPF